MSVVETRTKLGLSALKNPPQKPLNTVILGVKPSSPPSPHPDKVKC